MIAARPCYTLLHDAVVLLTVDADLTPPFTVGEHVTLRCANTGQSDGCFVVTHLSREVAYHLTDEHRPCRIPLAGQEVTVHLEKLDTPREEGSAPCIP